MGGFILYILTALALIFVIEGLLYAVFPDAIKRMMAVAIGMETRMLRALGFSMAAMGLLMIWLLDRLSSPL